MGKCSTCEKLKEIRRKAVLPEQRDRAAATQSAHVAAVLKDRRVDALVQGKAEESIMASNPGSPWAETILNWDQDWMDQAKFRCPRNTSMNKQFADMWRPQLGAGGVTMDGIGSFIFLTDLDLGKHADVQLTLTCRALEVAFGQLSARGLPMPAHFLCYSDNATGETKNNSMFQWMCWLVARRKIVSGMLCQGRVGHTHTGGKTEHLLRLLEACGAVASWRTRAILQNASGNACPPKHAESSRLTNLKGPCLGGRSLPGCLRTFVLKA